MKEVKQESNIHSEKWIMVYLRWQEYIIAKTNAPFLPRKLAQ